MPDPKLPEEYLDLTLRDLLDRYDGPGAEPCPAELTEWLALARKARDVAALKRENDAREAELIRRRTERFGAQ